MQHFIPFPDFIRSAQCLDRSRLGKQRQETKECLQVNRQRDGKPDLPTLSEEYKALLWRRYNRHPAALMWADYELALCLYGVEICKEWERRGYNDNTKHFFVDVIINDYLCKTLQEAYNKVVYPPWWGDWSVHITHMSMLFQKNPEHYGPQWKQYFLETGYYWPIDTTNFESTRRFRYFIDTETDEVIVKPDNQATEFWWCESDNNIERMSEHDYFNHMHLCNFKGED